MAIDFGKVLLQAVKKDQNSLIGKTNDQDSKKAFVIYRPSSTKTVGNSKKKTVTVQGNTHKTSKGLKVENPIGVVSNAIAHPVGTPAFSSDRAHGRNAETSVRTGAGGRSYGAKEKAFAKDIPQNVYQQKLKEIEEKKKAIKEYRGEKPRGKNAETSISVGTNQKGPVNVRQKQKTKEAITAGMERSIEKNAGTRGYMGFVEGLLPGNLEKDYRRRFGDETVDKMKEKASYQVGNVAGTLAQYGTVYGLAGGAGFGKMVSKLPQVQRLSPFGQAVARNTAYDTVFGTPLNYEFARSQGLEGKDLAKNMALNAALDFGVGGAIEAAPFAWRALKNANAAETITEFSERVSPRFPALQGDGKVQYVKLPETAATQTNYVKPTETVAAQTNRVKVHGNVPARRKEAAAAYGKAVSVQRDLNNMLSDIANEMNLAYTPSTQKSIQSMIDKVVRKNTPESPYTFMDVNDHARSKLDLDSFDQIPEVLKKLKERGIPYETKVADTEWGYKGFHITYRTADGIGAEIQLTTPEIWKVKKESDLIYERWRNVTDVESLSSTEQLKYYKDMERSLQMWNQSNLPDFNKYLTSSSDNRVALKISSDETGEEVLPHLPLENSNKPLPSRRGSTSSSRPDSVKQNMPIKSSPSDTANIPQKVKKINRIEGAKATADRSAFKDLGANKAKTFKNKTELLNEYGAMKRGEKVFIDGKDVTRNIKVPRATQFGEVQEHVRTLLESPIVDDKLYKNINESIVEGYFQRIKMGNRTAVENANALLEQSGLDGALKRFFDNIKSNQPVTSRDIALGNRLLQELQKGGDYEQALQVATELSSMLSETGRTLQAARIAKRLSPDGRLLLAERTAEKISKMTGTKVELPPEIAEQVTKAVEENDIVKANQAVGKALWDQVPPTFEEKVRAWRYLSMLANPKTHIRNIVGNAIFTPARKMKNLIAYGLENTRLNRTGEKTKSILNPFSEKDMKLKELAKKDYKNMDALLKGEGKYDDSVRDLNAKIFENPLLEQLRKWNMNTLDWEDTLFLRSTYADSLAQWMKANKYSPASFEELMKKRHNSELKAARQYAMNEALRATYRDANKFATVLRNIEENALRSESKVAKVGGLLMSGVIPFKSTPINILRRGVEFSPIGLLDGISKMMKSVKTGEVAASEAIDRLAAGLSGTGIVALGAWLGHMGIATGGLEKPYGKEAQYKRMNGEQEYAIDLGDATYTVDWASPIAMPFFVGVELNRMCQKDGLSFWEVINGISTIAEPVTNLSMLQGLNEVAKTGFEENALWPMIQKAGENYAGQFVPTVFGQIARTIDDTRRTTTSTADNAAQRTAERFANRQISKIPGASQTLQPYVDLWGRTDQENRIGMRVFENFLSPGYISEKKETSVDRELMKFSEDLSTADARKIYPRLTNTYDLMINHKEYRMTEEELARFKQVRGRTAYSELQRLFRSSAYHYMTEEQKIKAIGRAYDAASDAAKEDFAKKRRL